MADEPTIGQSMADIAVALQNLNKTDTTYKVLKDILDKLKDNEQLLKDIKEVLQQA